MATIVSCILCVVELSFGEELIEDHALNEGSLLEDYRSEDRDSSCVSVHLHET